MLRSRSRTFGSAPTVKKRTKNAWPFNTHFLFSLFFTFNIYVATTFGNKAGQHTALIVCDTANDCLCVMKKDSSVLKIVGKKLNTINGVGLAQ